MLTLFSQFQKKPQLDLSEEERTVWEMLELAKEVSEACDFYLLYLLCQAVSAVFFIVTVFLEGFLHRLSTEISCEDEICRNSSHTVLATSSSNAQPIGLER